ncbi:MAG: DUF503 domain-containing protein [Chloroflexi bacterium]|nr:DUF503 domain-containing protein [Chloroflexota bacterium]
MVIGSALIELDLPGNGTLKDKRRIIKSVLARLRHEYNLAVAEVDALDQRAIAIIALVTVSNDVRYAHGLLEKAITSLAESRLDCDIAHYQIEIL